MTFTKTQIFLAYIITAFFGGSTFLGAIALFLCVAALNGDNISENAMSAICITFGLFAVGALGSAGKLYFRLKNDKENEQDK
jgi:hypothetical protein